MDSDDENNHKKKGGLRKSEILSDDPEETFEMLDIVGEGSYGLICTCRNIKQDQVFAIKFLEIAEEDEENLQKEIDILKESINCESIVKYYGSYLKDNTLMIVMEFCDGGSALDIMNSLKKPFSEAQVAAMVSNMVQGLVYLHHHKILHRDIKAGNVLLTSEGKAKLADFGVSAKLTHTLQKKNTMVGSPYWMAPEVISQKKKEGYDMKTDIWSLGITAIELAEGKPPLFDIASLRVIFLIPARDPPTLQDAKKWSPEFNDFIHVCLQKNPENRPSAQELLDHPFVQMGMQRDKEGILKTLVQQSLPLLKEARLNKKNKKRPTEKDDSDDEDDDRMVPGSIISVNSKTKAWSHASSANSYGTTVITDSSSSYGTVQMN